MKQSLWWAAIFLILAFQQENSFAESDNKKTIQPIYAVVGGQPQNHSNPFADNDHTKKIIARTNLEQEANDLARHGLFDQALLKYQQALDPALLNYESDKGMALGGIRDIHQRQGKFELALKEHQWFLDAYEKSSFSKDNSGRYTNTVIDKKLELEALIKARDTKSNKLIYDYIDYLRMKYATQLPPIDFNGYGPRVAGDIIHLYDYLGDIDSAIAFLNQIVDYLQRANHGSNGEKIAIEDYENAEKAFVEDKRSGQKGHLQKVLESSEIIGW